MRDPLIVRIADVLMLTDGVDRVEDDPRADRQRKRIDELTGQAVDKVSRVLSG